MDTTIASNKSHRVTVTCVECGDIDQLNDRHARRKAAEGKDHVCRLCRAVGDAKPGEAELAWWRARYTQDEINAIVGAIL